MEVFNLNPQQIYPLVDINSENSQQFYPDVDYDILQKYGESNTQFTIALILQSREDEEEKAIGYNCLYRYDTHRVNLEYIFDTQRWKIIPEELSNILLNDIQFLTLDEQIQTIIKRLDQQFFDLEKHQYQTKLSIPPAYREEHIELSHLAIPEDDESQKYTKDVVDYGLHSVVTGQRSKFSGLPPPPVAPRRSRQNSACSTQSSVRYAVFTPPSPVPTAPIRRRRVIESIHLHVERKKKTFEKIVDAMRGTEPVTMHDLGLEFLRVYDGRFNYRTGHTFVMSYRKKTWYLTMDKVTCVDCAVGEVGPRSVLILEYKHKYTSVHV